MTYKRAPITEAVMDVRVQPLADMDMSAVDRLSELIALRYPKRKERLSFNAKFDLASVEPTDVEKKRIGFEFRGTNDDRLFQVQRDRWTFHKLEPYENWEKFQGEAVELWDLYSGIVKSARRSRLALRYINRLDLPLPFDNLSHYLQTLPSVSPKLPQGLAGYFMQLQIPFEDINAFLFLNQAVVPPSKPDTVSVVLDLDIFIEDNVPQDDESMWEAFEMLRKKKNEAFEACITDAARELFQ